MCGQPYNGISSPIQSSRRQALDILQVTLPPIEQLQTYLSRTVHDVAIQMTDLSPPADASLAYELSLSSSTSAASSCRENPTIIEQC